MSIPKGIRLAQQALKTARSNLREGDTNAACNRAYYAAFRALKGILNTAGLATKTHKGARTLFGKYFPALSKGGLTSSKIFAEIERARLLADYSDEFIPHDEALRAVRQAEGFVAAILEQYFPSALEHENEVRPSAAKTPVADEETATETGAPQP